MKIPCVCIDGNHSLTAKEMVQVIGAFQRGELHRVKYEKGIAVGIYPVCVMKTDFNAGFHTDTVTHCAVLLDNGQTCNHARGHTDGPHEHR